MTVLTKMLPSIAKWFNHVTYPPPVTVRAAPLLTAPLKILKLSPAARAVTPIFVTVTVPVPPLVMTPVADITSFDCAGESDLFTRIKTLPPTKVMVLLTVKVPMAPAVPAPTVPLVYTASGLLTLPLRSEERRVGKEGRSRWAP